MIINEDGSTSISVYDDSPLDQNTYQSGELQLQTRFSNFDEKFSFLMLQLLKKKKFTNQRFKDAVEYVIVNEKFPTITPAAILNYDKVLELKTNLWIRQKMKEFGSSIWEYYDVVDCDGQCMYVEKGKMERLGI